VRELTRRHVVAASFACAALAAAVAGRLSACAGCEYEVAGIPVFVLGSVYNLALGLLALFGTPLVRIGWVSLPGLAIQAGLVRYLLMLGAPCWTCLAAGACLFALSLVCLVPHRAWRFAPPAIAIAGFLSLPLWSGALVQSERVGALPEFARPEDLRSPPEGAILFVVYVREGCPYCRLFDRDYVPRMKNELWARFEVRKVDARDRKGLGRVPTFLIRMRNGSLLVIRGLPPYYEFEAMLDAAERP